MSYEFAPANYSLAVAYQAAKARRIRMSSYAMPDEEIVSPREYARRKRERRDKERLESLGRSRAMSSLSAANATPSLPGAEAKTDPAPLTQAQKILRDVATAYGTSVMAMRGGGRWARVMSARRVAAWRLRQIQVNGAPMPLNTIGRLLRKDHSSILHAIRQYEAGNVKQPESFPPPKKASRKTTSTTKHDPYKKWSLPDLLAIRKWKQDGFSYREIGLHFGVARSAVQHALRRFERKE